MNQQGYGNKFHDPSQQGSSAPFLEYMPEQPPAYSIVDDRFVPNIQASPGPRESGQNSVEEVAARVKSTRRTVLYNAPKKERSIFLRKVYAVLLGMSVGVCSIISIFLYLPVELQYFQFEEMSGWKFWPVWITLLSFASLVSSFDKTMRQPPLNFVLVTTITIVFGLLLGALSAYIQSIKILIDVGIVGIICIFVITFTFQRKYEYTPIRSFFYVTAYLVAAFGFLCIAYCPLDAFYIMIAPAIFFIYVVVATQFMIKDDDLMILSSEYIYAAVSVCMFFVALLSKIVRPCCRCRCCPASYLNRSTLVVSVVTNY